LPNNSSMPATDHFSLFLLDSGIKSRYHASSVVSHKYLYNPFAVSSSTGSGQACRIHERNSLKYFTLRQAQGERIV
jgi:hypothetical protein